MSLIGSLLPAAGVQAGSLWSRLLPQPQGAAHRLLGGLFDGKPGMMSHRTGAAAPAPAAPAQDRVPTWRILEGLIAGNLPSRTIDGYRAAQAVGQQRQQLMQAAEQANLSPEERIALLTNPGKLGEAMATGTEAFTLNRNGVRGFRGDMVQNDAPADPLVVDKALVGPDGQVIYQAPQYTTVGSGQSLVEVRPGVGMGAGQPPAGASSPTGSGSRGFRNNNWLNIRDTGDDWQGKVGSDGAFVQFDTPENGLRAADRVLQTYATKHGLDTVEGIIGRWAPQSENDTAAYVQTVSKALQVAPNARLDMANPGVREALLREMAKVENGFDPFAVNRGPQEPRVVLAATAGKTRMAPEEIAAAGLQPGTVAYMDEKGKPVVIDKLDSGERQTANYTNRAISGLEKLNALAERKIYKPTAQLEFIDPIFGKASFRIRNATDRQFVQAAKEFLAPVLRKDTGAAVTDTELDTYMDIYIPRSTDDPQTLWQKAQARADAVRGLMAESGGGFSALFPDAPKLRSLTDPRGQSGGVKKTAEQAGVRVRVGGGTAVVREVR